MGQKPRPGLWVLVALVGLALLLQASRLPFRWNQFALSYAAYFHEFRHSVAVLGWPAAFTTYIGLHPPAYSWVFASLMGAGAPPGAWLALSGLFSVAAVPLVWATARVAGGATGAWTAAAAAAAVLAISPHRNAYGLEINNYPLLVGVTAGQLLAFAKLVSEPPSPNPVAEHQSLRLTRTEWGWLALTALSVWTHVLSLALPLSQAGVLLLRPEGRRYRRRLVPLLGGAAILCLPLLPGALGGAQADPINKTPGLGVALHTAFIAFPSRYGSPWAAALLGVLLGIGAWRALRLRGNAGLAASAWLAHLVLAGTFIVGMVATGVAASHQLPYYLVLLPAAGLLVGLGVDSPGPTRPIRWALIIGALLLHLSVLGSEALRGHDTWSQAPRTRSMVALALERWTPGSTLLLFGLPTQFDDGKDVVDPTYALVPLSEPVHFNQPPVDGLVQADPNWGNPLRFPDDRWLYTFAGFRTEYVGPIVETSLSRNHRVLLALYDTANGVGELARAEAWSLERGVRGLRAKDQVLFVLEPGLPEDAPPLAPEQSPLTQPDGEPQAEQQPRTQSTSLETD